MNNLKIRFSCMNRLFKIVLITLNNRNWRWKNSIEVRFKYMNRLLKVKLSLSSNRSRLLKINTKLILKHRIFRLGALRNKLRINRNYSTI